MKPIRSMLLSTAVSASLLACATAATAQQTASSSSTMSAPANDTAVNKRDRSSQTMKPTDQPEDKADIKLAAAVRRSIYKDKSLSTSAHNVKLVAAQGVVTLRGPVKNADEKAKVEADAKAVSGVSSVDNQLDVKN
ncbi:osmotically-inducible protein OsmY [Rhodanobacter sp. K2T2]|uniref:BON domain-containing protein n=1 Tax=Rhodanobacter sp. K2T2 TaxID=2723085 RepID=UPI00183B5E94|nr:BON domain-containing protein [Rhodanobacter sp. K2T2]NYE30051.1 osmotically-inducible protein OsmY [Rhodanobacter sp. K2T2]